MEKEPSPEPSIHSDVRSVAASFTKQAMKTKNNAMFQPGGPKIVEEPQPTPLKEDYIPTEKDNEEKLLEGKFFTTRL